ncbi:MAG: hypothetical protein A2W05_02635 [Candidatus Schekmanbacteria bacterium RBG_16_38_10]|uniref:Uncharacterized protein n=1 Tax=Candidatus Schekmanbacteria bacterium RBG_16_38_10 TaxID=1817879 RepID=A0A1F7RMT0_9BACT|nr:MAG: hypothetical protein A2W05_02635 [Candidatus Schekmanbacteria bacterium RBG_16_38_10]
MGRRFKLIFDGKWFLSAKGKSPQDSWARPVIETLDEGGLEYLNTLRLWFDKFPLNQKRKKDLKNKIQSFKIDEHLGAVNELSWYAFMTLFNWDVDPISERGKHPDFYIKKPSKFYCEVTTLNISASDKSAPCSRIGGLINHEQPINRILRKVLDEKFSQLNYGFIRKKPSIMVVLDYSTDSIGTQRCHAFAKSLLKNLNLLPVSLSALLYVEKYVDKGKIKINSQKSSVYHNPNAKFKLPLSAFKMLPQFSCSLLERLPKNPKRIEYELK